LIQTKPTVDEYRLSTLRVLVVDDQPHVRDWVVGVLGGMGVQHITAAANGREALAAVAKPGIRFHLILVDLHMPEMDGVELIRAFGAMGIDATVAVMSVESERVIDTASALAEAHGLRVLGTVPKPLTAEKLEPILERMFEPPPADAWEAHNADALDFEEAFGGRQLAMMYQPKVRIDTGEFVGAEALVRWRHPKLGTLLPGVFLPVINKSGVLATMLVDYTVGETLACAERWRAAGRELPVSINFAARAFDDLTLPDRLAAAAVAHGVVPSTVTIEVPESFVTRDAVRMLDIATRLRMKGFRLSLDAFGSGTLGPAQLMHTPFEEIKLAAESVDGCAASSHKQTEVAATVALAKSLKMTSVASGVQTQADWDLLAQLGCQQAQGHFVARPMTESGLVSWVQHLPAH
jgi:EAL domain-containing protein (putative c-di-GMP-specific phosphodiesterase class I)/ActR/RegA family two-component response regulator